MTQILISKKETIKGRSFYKNVFSVRPVNGVFEVSNCETNEVMMNLKKAQLDALLKNSEAQGMKIEKIER